MDILRILSACFGVAVLFFTQSPASLAAGADSGAYNIDAFFATVDRSGDGNISREEWKEMGLMEPFFPLCDRDKDGSIPRSEMASCAIPQAMDTRQEGVLTIYSGGRFVIQSPGAPIPKPEKAPPGITQATQFVADSPYVEGGPTGEDFIKLFDKDGDGRVGHMEWESLKNDTVFQPFRWPQYNRNRDQWITLDEAPRLPAK